MSAVPDVVVVGAGPAGAAVAARLAAAGRAVLLLDRERFPRPKPCGDCVNPAAIAELDTLGALDAVRREPHAPIRGWRVVPLEGSAFQGAYPPGRPGMAIARERLDRVLLEHARAAGAEVRLGERVTDLVRGERGVEGVVLGTGAGRREIRCRLVVGADGLRSVVVRRLGLLLRPPRLRKLALTSHVRGIGGVEEGGELHVVPWGTVGIAPIGGGVCNVTLVLPEREAGGVAGAKEEYFDRVLAACPRLRGARREAEVLATGPFDWPTRGAVADGAALVGDAAGYFDPFTGQGIYRALRGAALLAATAEEALRRDDLSSRGLQPYERARRRAFGPGTRLQRLIETFLARPALMRVAGDRFHRRPPLADALVAVTGDLLPVRTLWAPRTLARLLG